MTSFRTDRCIKTLITKLCDDSSSTVQETSLKRGQIKQIFLINEFVLTLLKNLKLTRNLNFLYTLL